VKLFAGVARSQARPVAATRVTFVRYVPIDAGGRRVNNASVTVALYREGKVYARAAGRTVAGRMTFDRPASTTVT